MLKELESRFSVRILPIRIIGKRWAYRGEKHPGKLPLATSHRIALSREDGVIVYGWDELDDSQKNQLEKVLKERYSD
ncbi:MAG: hypothetical protein ACOC41_04980 [Chitinivibrionales bacterium]